MSLLVASPSAFASDYVPPAPVGPDGGSLLGSGTGQANGNTTGSTADPSLSTPCSPSYGRVSFSGLPGTPRTINFSGEISCGSPVISVRGQSRLFYGMFIERNHPLEAEGNVCTSVSHCFSNESYFHIYRTAPWMIHILQWEYSATLATGNKWVEGASGSSCSGYGTRTLRCSYDWEFNVPMP